MSSEIITALIAMAVALGTGLITNAGRKDETEATRLQALIEGQAGRVQTLEQRLDSVEERLAKTETKLRSSQEHNHALRHALSEALSWVIDALEWLNGPQDTPHPKEPDFEEWRRILEYKDA